MDGTPLSSQRSCSEFLRFNSLNNNQKAQLMEELSMRNEKKKRSFFSYIFGRGSNVGARSLSGASNATLQHQPLSAYDVSSSAAAANTKRVQFMDEDEAAFLVSQLRGTSGRTESTSHSSSSHSGYTRFQSNSGSSSVDRDPPVLFEEPGCMDFVFGAVPERSSARLGRNALLQASNAALYSSTSPSSFSSSMTSSRTAILQESSMALDLILGISSYGSRKKLPMEIELKTLERPSRGTAQTSESSTGTISRNPSRSSFSGLMSRSSISGMSDTLGGSSQHSIHSIPGLDHHSFGGDENPASGDGRAGEGGSGYLSSLVHGLSRTSRSALVWAARACHFALSGPEDEAFYEQVRIQPFATGAYLRGMLVAGFASLFFNIYCLSMWPDYNMLYGTSGAAADGFQPHHTVAENAMYAMLLTQLVFNALQLPVRISLHLECWESSRAVDVDVAINLIRNMLQSETWLVNRVLGRILDCLSVVTLVAGEVYLRCYPIEDVLQQLIVSLCATNLLALFVRLVMATAFALSMHDPQVLSDARRRGLSKWDLEVLPAFVFTSLREVTNPECSICLAAFDAGEMLISLPCDNKHSFHANCIRQWLERQNSCPLCQKLV